MSQVQAFEYFRRWWCEAWQNSEFLTLRKALGSIAYAVLRSALQDKMISLSHFFSGIVEPAVLAYAILCFGELVINLVRSPLALDRARNNDIIARNRTIAELTKPVPIRFRGEIQQLRVKPWQTGGNPSAMTVSVVMQVRDIGDQPDTSIHSIQLWMLGLDRPSGIFQEPCELKGRFWKRHMQIVFMAVPPSDIVRAKLTGTQWKFTFKDHNDTQYESDIFTKLEAG